MTGRRVVVTGIGVISGLGLDKQSFWNALSHGISGIRPMQLVDRSVLRFPNGAEVPDYNPAAHFDEKDIGLLDRFAQFGVVAAREAVRDAGIEFQAWGIGNLCCRPDDVRWLWSHHPPTDGRSDEP